MVHRKIKSKTSVKDYICGEIKYTCIDYLGVPVWKLHRKRIYDDLARLQPDKPTDGSLNVLAFVVPNKPKRLKLRTTRFLSRKLKLNSGFLSDAILQNLGDNINMNLFGLSPEHVRLLSGSQITNAYRDKLGTKSCMTKRPEYTRLYERNPERFKLFTISFNNDTGRALLVTLDNGQKYMDRVYASSETVKSKMIEYAEKQNWASYSGHRYSQADPDTLIVSGLDYIDGEIPYMDTFACGTIIDGKLTISFKGIADYNLQSLDGMLETGMTCEYCNENVYEDDVQYVGDSYYCQSCFRDHFFFCNDCEESYNLEDEVCIDDDFYVCTYCADDNYL
ncbi:hypothetical protein LCGC14_0946650, partial [marine sediment metagenome]